MMMIFLDTRNFEFLLENTHTQYIYIYIYIYVNKEKKLKRKWKSNIRVDLGTNSIHDMDYWRVFLKAAIGQQVR